MIKWSALIHISFGFVLTVVFTPSATISENTMLENQDKRFGVVEAYDAPGRATELGVGWTRAKFHWGLIQPDSPEQWEEPDINASDLAGELDAGREVIGLLAGMPEWAQDEAGIPVGLYLEHTDPANAWAVWVQTVVSHYKDQINHWIIWNEPDIWDETHPAYSWPGTEEDFVQLLKVAYLTAQEANPEVVIHLAAVSHWWDVQYDRELYFQRLLDVLVAEPDAAKHSYYYDVATLHAYFDPVSVYELLVLYKDIQLTHGIDKPFWLIETNAAPSSDPARVVGKPTFTISMLEQAAYMPQGLSMALAGGAERAGIFKLIDTPGDLVANPEPFGLVRADDSTRPAFRTSQVAIDLLSDAQEVTWHDHGAVAEVVVKKSGEIVRLLWARLPQGQVITIPVAGSDVKMLDMWGNSLAVNWTEANQYRVQLSGGECQETVGDYCMIGGAPIYIVEQLDDEISVLGDWPVIVLADQDALSDATVARSNTLKWVGAGGGVLLMLAVGAASGLFISSKLYTARKEDK